MGPIDAETIGQLQAALPRDDLIAILRTFAADLDRLAGEFEAAAQAGDPEGCRRVAHSLAGTAASIGAQALSADARRAMAPDTPVPLATAALELRQQTDAASTALVRLAEVLAASG